MYLHLGASVVVPMDSIIGIFDLDKTSWSHITRKFLSDAEKSGKIENISDDIPKSFILCCDNMSNTETRIYLSQLSSQTLLKRAESFLKGTLYGGKYQYT